MKRGLFLVALVSIFALFLFMSAPQSQAALAGDGTNGEITCGTFNAQYDTALVFWISNLDADSDYGVAWGASSTATTASQFNFTTGGDQSTFSFTETFEETDTSTGDMLRIGLWPGGSCNSVSAAANAIDYFEIKFSDIAEQFPTGWFIQLGVALIIVLIIVGLVSGMIAWGRR